MYSSSEHTEPLTESSAKAIAREWIDNRIEEPRKQNSWSQMRWLMNQLAERCIAESLRLDEDEDGLCQRLDDAHDILFTAWYSSAPEYATSWRFSEEDQPDAEEQEKIERAQHLLWTRHDPARSLQEGTRSIDFTVIDVDSLNSAIADYLDRPYLRHPFLDWTFVDMTVSRELSTYGEALKQKLVPGRQDPFLEIHHRYWSARGNLAEMTKIDWNETFELWSVWFWCGLGFPIGGIWAAFYFGYVTTGWWLAGIYATIVIGFIAIKLIRFCLRLIGRVAGKPDPRVKAVALWDQMYEVWRRLEGPVVNPKLVREAMVRSTDQGAVWDTVSWSLIDRVTAIDPAVWVVQPNKT